MNTFNLALDLDKGNSLFNLPVTIRQGDKNGTEVHAEIFDHGQALSLSGYTWHLCMRLPNSDQYYRTEATFANGVATATINENSAAAIVGTTELVHFEAVSGTKEYSTQDFTVIVLPDPTADAELAEPYDSRIEQALAELDDATGRIAAMVQDATEEYLEAHPELTTTVEDNSLTDAKLIQHGGILDRVARLWHRLDNLLTATPAEADALTVTDAAKTPLAGLALYGRSTQDGTPTPSAPVAIVSVEPDSDGGVKFQAVGRNLLPINQVTRKFNGVTAKVNADGTVTVSGTSSSEGDLYIFGGWRTSSVALPYLITGHSYELTIDTPNPNVTARIYTFTAEGNQVGSANTDSNGRATFTLLETAKRFGVSVRVASGATVDATVRLQLAEHVTGQYWPYEPYVGVTIPIDLDGRSLRSLPDGTRDEVTVGADGHAVLVQRVGVNVLDGDENWIIANGGTQNWFYYLSNVDVLPASTLNILCNAYPAETVANNNTVQGIWRLTNMVRIRWGTEQTVADYKAWLAENPVTLLYPLATPQTIDLGTIDPIALQGPDMTAQAVPTAPFALTYERDLNATLARLEASIAELATN